jgi:phosphohistidine swiveling domain-containing protein
MTTTTTTAAAEQGFTPPGPGVWMVDATHWTRPLTRFQAELFPDPFRRGFGEGLRRYGSLLEYLDVGFSNGFPYYRPRPVGAPEHVDAHPPREVWDELASSHPEIRERLATSARVFERKLWREDLEGWDREVKPAATRAHLELLAVDPHSLDAGELLAYLDRCRDNQIQGAYLHHLFNVPALLPIGDFLVHAREWTGRPADELLGLLRGANPDPLGAADELARLVVALRRDRAALELLSTPAEPAEVVAALRSLPVEAGALAAAYVDRVGYRPVNGEDVGEPSVHELPELIVAAIRAAVDAVASGTEAEELESRTSDVRADVPREQRAAFDELLAEARAVSRLRDERGSYADLWAIGIMRRAILAAGARLAGSGRIGDPAHLAEAGYAEIRTLVGTGDGPTAEELAERARYRLQARYADAPPFLGGEPAPPLPPEWLPAAAARLERAIGAVVEEMLFAPKPQTEERNVRGVGVSPGVYEGTARLIHSTEEFGRIERGDVLVTNSTTTAFNIVLPLLGAIVTDRGGLLSHAAIVAREYAIPAVVGCSDATAVVADGDRVRVDGRAGEVEVLA